MKKSTPATNPMKLAGQTAAFCRELSADDLGEFSRVLRKVAKAFARVGAQKEADLLKKYATGFNRGAGKRGLVEE